MINEFENEDNSITKMNPGKVYKIMIALTFVLMLVTVFLQLYRLDSRKHTADEIYCQASVCNRN